MKRFIECSDRIVIEDPLDDIPTERLKGLLNLFEMCKDCEGCEPFAKRIREVLERRVDKRA